MHILFVCSGNIFRSVAAEYCARLYLEQHQHFDATVITISSAGTFAVQESASRVLIEELRKIGIDASHHISQRVSIALLETADIVVAMSTIHQDFLRTNYDRESYLFNELAFGEQTSVLDVDEAISDYQTNREAYATYIASVVRHINQGIPVLMKRATEIWRSQQAKMQRIGE